MPVAQGANYNYGSIYSLCSANGTGIIRITGVSTDANTSLFFDILDGEGNQVGAYGFPTDTVNGTVDIDGLMNGTHTIEINASSGQTHFATSTVSCSYVCNIAVPSVTVTNVTTYGGTDGAVVVNMTGESYPEYAILKHGGTMTAYQAGNGFTGLTAGTYTAYARSTWDADCVASKTFTITQPAYACNLVISGVAVLATNSRANPNGRATVTATSANVIQYAIKRGNGVYSALQSSNVFNGLSDGYYTAKTVDANGCEDTEQFTITYQPLPTGNSGLRGWNTLEQYYVDNGQTTGVTKPNTVGDPNYQAPVQNTTACPIYRTEHVEASEPIGGGES